MTFKLLRAGTRGSPLALTQTRLYLKTLQAAHALLGSQVEFEIVTIKTSGDLLPSAHPAQVFEARGKGIFVKEIEEALLARRIDFAVHSLKDLPAEIVPGLTLCGYQKRQDPRDVLVAKTAFEHLPNGATIGTASLRRQFQLQELAHLSHKHFTYVALRGNVETRVRKVLGGDLGGVVLSAAGIGRLGLERAITSYFDPMKEMIPACGQGSLVAEINEDRPELFAFLNQAQDQDSFEAAGLERLCLKILGGGCLEALGIMAAKGPKIPWQVYLYRHDGRDTQAPGRRRHFELSAPNPLAALKEHLDGIDKKNFLV